MLCDLLAMPWRDANAYPRTPASESPDLKRLADICSDAKSEAEVRLRAGDAYDRYMSAAKQLRPEIDRYVREVEAWKKDPRPALEGDSWFGFSRIEEFRSILTESQKFTLTRDFVHASLADLATPETVIKAAEWFRLTHDPMWLEWNFDGFYMGAVFHSVKTDQGEEVWCYLARGVAQSDYKNFWISRVRLRPETIRRTDTGFAMDMHDESGEIVPSDSSESKLALTFYDVIIRINSPRITDVRPCEDLSKINKKRARLGRPPLLSYHVVDLNKEIKAQLRQVDNEGVGVRFHWRRGHFKARKTGLFWWNPHTAGRKVFGEIRKDYAA